MSLALAIFLGFVQALTEFLPVSSSGHLVLAQTYLGAWLGVGHVPLAFDVFVHLATLAATFVFLWPDIWVILASLFSKDREKQTRALWLILLVCLASVPAGFVGIVLGDIVRASFSSVRMTGLGFLCTAIILEGAHQRQLKNEGSDSSELDNKKGFTWQLPSLQQALLIGCFQALAVFPGVSRSGSTIGVALYAGLSRATAVRFSFLLSIPAILGATLLEFEEMLAFQEAGWGVYLGAGLTAFLGGLLAIRLLVRAVAKVKLRNFSIYTLILGLSCLLFAP